MEATVQSLKGQIAELERTIEDKESALVGRKKKRTKNWNVKRRWNPVYLQEFEATVTQVAALEQEKETLTMSYQALEAQATSTTNYHQEAAVALQKSLQEIEGKETEVSKELENVKAQLLEAPASGDGKHRSH